MPNLFRHPTQGDKCISSSYEIPKQVRDDVGIKEKSDPVNQAALFI